MFAIADQVRTWQAEGRPVTIARVAVTRGFSSGNPADALAVTPGAPWAGGLLSGAADVELGRQLEQADGAGGLVEIKVSDADAESVGLSCGGLAQVLFQPAADIDDAAWSLLAEQQPLCLVTELANPSHTQWATAESAAALADEAATVFARGASRLELTEDLLINALWPAPHLLVVGRGAIAEALQQVGALLDWSSAVIDDGDGARDAASSLRPGDACVVLSHDLNVSGAALLAATRAAASYVGALGSRRTQAARSGWLSKHGATEAQLDKIHGPAGLDLGALTPAEIALAIIAEAMAVRTHRSAASLRQGAPIH
ncbi:MAG: xanthine dehydrogenase [Frankiales bacterium]|nr:xanthine dehydrogenase [Frankiales bacterium]